MPSARPGSHVVGDGFQAKPDEAQGGDAPDVPASYPVTPRKWETVYDAGGAGSPISFAECEEN